MPILITDEALNDALELWGSQINPKFSKARLAQMILESAIQKTCPYDNVVEGYGAETRWANVKRGAPRVWGRGSRTARPRRAEVDPPQPPPVPPPSLQKEAEAAAAPKPDEKPIVTRPPGMRPIAT